VESPAPAIAAGICAARPHGSGHRQRGRRSAAIWQAAASMAGPVKASRIQVPIDIGEVRLATRSML
jgi:hypothetical protein